MAENPYEKVPVAKNKPQEAPGCFYLNIALEFDSENAAAAMLLAQMIQADIENDGQDGITITSFKLWHENEFGGEVVFIDDEENEADRALRKLTSNKGGDQWEKYTDSIKDSTK